MNTVVVKLFASLCISLFTSVLCAFPSDAEDGLSYAPLKYNKRFINDQIVSGKIPGKVFYVNPQAPEAGEGTKLSPFQTLESARDAIREIKTNENGLPEGGIHVILMDGMFQRTEPFELLKQDSGTREAPIVYRGIEKGKVLIAGGSPVDVRNAKLVKGPDLAWLHKRAQGKVGFVEVPTELRHLFTDGRRYGMVAMDGHVLDLAQWPNRGYNHIGEIIDRGPSTRTMKPGRKPPEFSKEKPSGGKFTVQERLSPLVQNEFERTGSIHVQGYLHNDWYFQNEPIGKMQNGVIQLLKHTRYGIEDKIKGIPRRIRLVNVLAELDQPGEWYFDQESGKLFFWPIKGFDKDRSSMHILGGKALVNLKQASFVTFSGIVFENAGDVAVRVRHGEHNLIAASSIRNGSYAGIAIEGGKHNGITGCDFHGLEVAFSISGGNAKRLERCYNFATNNEVHSCRRRGYGVVGLSGVGLYFAHNLLHDMNGAVTYKTIDSLLEFNEFYNIGYEMGDFNVAYCGAQWHSMNNVLRFNFVHHLFEPGGHPVAAFRNDDGGAGMKVYGNVFYRSGRGSVQFAGPLNDFVNNISIDSNMMWWTNKSPISNGDVRKAWDDLRRFGRDLPKGDKGDNIFLMEKLLGEKGWLKSPWIDEFPQLAKAIELNPFAQTYCRVSTNYIGNIKEPFHIHGGDGSIAGMESGETGISSDLPKEGLFETPWQISPEAFSDLNALDFGFQEKFKPVKGFEPIPFSTIGLVKDEFRPDPPNKAAYRSEVLKRFRNEKGGKYDARVINRRYPPRSYQ